MADRAAVSPPPAQNRSTRRIGLLYAALAALCASSAGLLLRHVEAADGWTLLFYRSLGFAGVVLLFTLVQHRRGVLRAFVAIGRTGLLAAVCLGGAFIAFIFSMLHTTVANAVALLSVAPMVAGLIGWLLLRERPHALSWTAMALAAAGVALTVREGLALGGGAGILFGAAACLGFAGAVVALRAGRDRDMMPAIVLSGAVAFAICLPAVDTVVIGRNDLMIALLLGSVQIGGQYILITLAARRIPASDIALMMILEVLLAPLWVWIFAGEAIAALTLAGGGVILIALALNAVAPPAQSAPTASRASA
ncbi:MAG: DMT family transporter [Alphaproteobacteria bacterium]|nr:DMT family transporter [Alphaproteobacteria bacterium]